MIKQFSTLISSSSTAIATTSSHLLLLSLLLSTLPLRNTILSIFKSSIFKSTVVFNNYNYRDLYRHHHHHLYYSQLHYHHRDNYHHHHLYQRYMATIITHKDSHDNMIDSIVETNETNNSNKHGDDDVTIDSSNSNIHPVVVLDKERFNTIINLVALRIPIKSCNTFLKELHHYTYDR